MSAPPMIEARDLVVMHAGRRSLLRRAVPKVALAGVSLCVHRGQTLAVVGESGSGKSTLARTLLRLHRPDRGQVLIDGIDLAILRPDELRQQRRLVQMVFQDPVSSLDPVMTVEQIVAEPLSLLPSGGSKLQRRDQVVAQLEAVGLTPQFLDRKPSQLSGGQAQRVSIARALVSEPAALICDEPVSALDVSLRAQVLELLQAQVRQRQLALVFVTHDLAAAQFLCAQTLVLHQGRVVEQGATHDVLANPAAAYTRLLLSAALPLAPAPRGMARSS
jgi:ABC-type glutathione transport system ATPase component